METLRKPVPDNEYEDTEFPFGVNLGIEQNMKEQARFSYTSGTEAYESTHRDPTVTDFNDTTEDE